MTTAQQLAARFREIHLSGKWVANTNIKDQLSQTNWEEAITKIENLNTIADLAFHIHYYVAGVLQVFKGGSLDIRDKYSFDAPPINSADEWTNRLEQFWLDAEHSASLVEQMTEEQLQASFVKEEYGNYHRNVDVLIEHGYYHLGQIVLIRKLVG